ncbi:MAG TPA: cobalamin-dependent protein, partial [Candidatus Brocadiales bacterium]|nr:cobalamin-dependent protein [Candidatus Brocadiales bacterium]
MSEILLVNSYLLSNDLNEQRVMKPYAPLGIQYISSYLKSKGHHVDIFDGTFRSIPEFRSTLERLKPKVVGIYANVITKETALEMSALAKQHNATVLVGGPGPVIDTDAYFASGVDVIVRGEGELTVEALINLNDLSDSEELQQIDGIIFKKNGRIVRTTDRKLIEDLDTIPLPDRESINIQRYMDAWKGKHGVSSVQILTARGCPYTCTWCSKEVFGNIYRKRKIEKVIEEIQLIKEKYNPDQLWFADDILTLKRDWILEFSSRVKEKNLAIPFECLARVDLVDEEVLAALKAI